MYFVLRIICILTMYVEQWPSSAADEEMFDKCHPDTYYKPYVKLLMKIGDPAIKEIKSTGFMDLSGHNRVILCINGAAFLYRAMLLEGLDEVASGDDPGPKLYTNASLGVYEHECMAINKISKRDTMAARGGTAKNINLFQEVFGVYLIGNEEDYRLPEMVQFNEDNFGHVVLSAVGEKPGGFSFAMIGSAPGDGFCTTVTANTSDGSQRTYKFKLLTQPGRVKGPHVSARRGIPSSIDDVFNQTLTEFTVWLPCHKEANTGSRFRTTTPRSGTPDINITQYQQFATYGHGTRIPVFSHDSEETTTEFGESTHRPELICSGICEVILSDETMALPDLLTSIKCGDGAQMGRLNDNVCYFWQYTADVYINLDKVGTLQWRLNIFDEVRKIVELSCPMVPPLMIELASQIVLGYYSFFLEGKLPHHDRFIKRQHSQWYKDLTEHLLLCRNKAQPMEFNYTYSLTSPDEEFTTSVRGFKKRHPGSSLYHKLHGNRTVDLDEYEEAPHVQNRKPPPPSDKYRQEHPSDIALVYNSTTRIPLFYHREGIELEKGLNYAIDVAWKAIAIVIGYCNVFYQAKKPELFPRFYNSFYEDFFEIVEPYWMSTADNEFIRNVMAEYMENHAINLWLDSCLEASYIYSSSDTYRPPRPLIFVEQNQYIANYFLELPNDVSILSATHTSPLRNLIRSTKFKRDLESTQSKPVQKQNNVVDDSISIPVNHPNNTPPPKKDTENVKPQIKPKGRIMG